MNEEEIEEFDWEFKPPYHKFFWAVIRSVGWYIVGISVVLIYTWPYIQKKWKSWKKKKDDQEYDAKYHKNVDLNSELLYSMQLAREKQQEKYLKDRELALKKEEEKREKKKREQLERLENQGSSGYKLNSDSSPSPGPSSSTSKSSKSSKAKLREEYNPLMGGGGGRYVPPKRSCCGKGGCG